MGLFLEHATFFSIVVIKKDETFCDDGDCHWSSGGIYRDIPLFFVSIQLSLQVMVYFTPKQIRCFSFYMGCIDSTNLVFIENAFHRQYIRNIRNIYLLELGF